jgi:hypothetical protein
MATRSSARYEDRTVVELREMARDRGVTGAARMRKEELIDAIRGAGRRRPSTRTSTKAASKPASKKAAATRAPAKKATSSRGRAAKAAPARRSSLDGDQTSRSLRYSQEVQDPSQHEERAGRSLFTTNPDVVRQWAEERRAVPATVGQRRTREPRVLRFKFPRSRATNLIEIDWDDWLRVFTDRNLRFIYQEHRTDGRPSNFFRLESPDREDG